MDLGTRIWHPPQIYDIKLISKRKASAVQPDSAKKKEKRQKWSWKAEAVEVLVKYIKEYKPKYESNGVDVEEDLLTIFCNPR